jgi:hypothetical protein
MPEIMIFKAGKYPQGDWPKERVQKLVDAYDPEKLYDAPLVIGHRWYGMDDSYQDAHGWVQSLRMDGAGKVFAVVVDITVELKRKVAEKKLKYMSVEIYEEDKIDKDKPPYLRAIALLGRDTPAVPGAKLPAYFSFAPGGMVCFAKEKEHTTVFTSKVGEVGIKIFSGSTENEWEVTMDELEKLKAEFAAQNAQLAAIQKENAELKNAESAAYFGKLRDEGKLPPALYEKAVALDSRLGEAERKDLRGLVGEFEKIVDLSGAHIANKKNAPQGDGIVAKIKAFQKEKGIASFEEAADALAVAHPDLFERGTA